MQGSSWDHATTSNSSMSTLSPVTMYLSMRCDPSTLAGRKAALEAALSKAVTEFGARDFRVEWTRVGPSEDTLQQVLPLLLECVEPETAAKFYRVCHIWNFQLEARGFCRRTVQLCSALSEGGDKQDGEREQLRTRVEHLQQITLQRLNTTIVPTERAVWVEASAFLQRSWVLGGSLAEWLQAASQEPDASFLARGASSTAQALGLHLVQWVGTVRRNHSSWEEEGVLSDWVHSVVFSQDGKRVASGHGDGRVKVWDTETAAEVSRFVLLISGR